MNDGLRHLIGNSAMPGRFVVFWNYLRKESQPITAICALFVAVVSLISGILYQKQERDFKEISIKPHIILFNSVDGTAGSYLVNEGGGSAHITELITTINGACVRVTKSDAIEKAPGIMNEYDNQSEEDLKSLAPKNVVFGFDRGVFHLSHVIRPGKYFKLFQVSVQRPTGYPLPGDVYNYLDTSWLSHIAAIPKISAP